MLVCAAASLAAVVVIAMHLPRGGEPFPTDTESRTPALAPIREYPSIEPVFATEQADFTCPDLDTMDEVPQTAVGPYDTQTTTESTEEGRYAYGAFTDYRCSGAPEGWEDPVDDGDLESPMVRVDLWARVVEDPVFLTVEAADPVGAEYFQDWEHASFDANLEVRNPSSENPFHWHTYHLSALDSNLLVTAAITYWYPDEGFEAERASEALAVALTEAVVDQIPRL